MEGSPLALRCVATVWCNSRSTLWHILGCNRHGDIEVDGHTVEWLLCVWVWVSERDSNLYRSCLPTTNRLHSIMVFARIYLCKPSRKLSVVSVCESLMRILFDVVSLLMVSPIMLFFFLFAILFSYEQHIYTKYIFWSNMFPLFSAVENMMFWNETKNLKSMQQFFPSGYTK